ncbi:MAG: glycosyltransferase [Clostridiales bacterium]|nr:glycosyltransferase [Candidatus Equinaster intestinalis]
MEPIRILILLGEPISSGGQEKFLINMLSNFERDKVNFDIFTPYGATDKANTEKLLSLGARIFEEHYSCTENKNANFKKAVTKFFSCHSYPIVHIHSGSTYALMTGSKIARKSGAKRVIVHSHCGGFANLKYRVIKAISFFPLLRYPTDYFACSALAADWKFPKPIIKQKKYRIINNAIDLSKMNYSPALREETRRELGFRDEFVIGHVGRFTVQKNHEFLIDIFASIAKKREDARLVLVGSGALKDKILEKVNALGLTDKVLYLGLRTDIAALMNAFDVFVLPSFFEGLPIVGVEAQATGLPIVTSTGVTRELPIEDLAEYIPLSAGADVWADKILDLPREPRRDTAEEMTQAGYELKSAALRLQKFYEEMA